MGNGYQEETDRFGYLSKERNERCEKGREKKKKKNREIEEPSAASSKKREKTRRRTERE